MTQATPEQQAAEAARELARFLANRSPLAPADLPSLRALLECVTRGCYLAIDATEADLARRLDEAEELYPTRTQPREY
ncbi:hypothetical protein D3C81_607680 [compost metagenome]